MVKTVAVILLLINMVFGMTVWLENHDDSRLRVIRLGAVLGLAVVLLLVVFRVG